MRRLLLGLGLLGVGVAGAWFALRPSVSVEQIHATVADEELALQLRERVILVERALMNLALPDHRSADVFESEVEVFDALEPGPRSEGRLGISDSAWSIEKKPRRVARDELRLLAGLIGRVRHFERVKLGVVRAVRAPDDANRLEMVLSLSAIGRGDGAFAIGGKIAVDWTRGELPAGPEQGEASRWRIARWKVKELASRHRARPMFAEVSEQVFPGSLLGLVRRSPHQEKVVQLAATGRLEDLDARRARNFEPSSTHYHPGLAIADVDGDGFEDIYVARRWAPNLLLRNRGDGTFEERAEALGLDVDGTSSSAVFADFDNDGDLDVFVGRMFERPVYLCNEGGRYVDRTASHVAAPLPYLTTSLSVADYDGDGLLDVYFATYGFANRFSAKGDAEFLRDFELDGEVGAELARRWKRARTTHHLDRWLRQAGPPNLLLRNVGGGKFEVSPHDHQVRGLANSFQGTWADFDDDGDVDLHVCNDFHPDHLYRNDGAAGFREVSELLGEGATTFAMGATWGDLDNDGRLDLYVSSMYSKAGKRITARFEGIDERLIHLASGNLLLRNETAGFRLRTDASKAGWSWACQFADLDNDGFRDLVVANGHFSAPPEVASTVDL